MVTAERTSRAAQSSRDNNSASYLGNSKKSFFFSSITGLSDLFWFVFPAKVKNFGRSGRTKYTHLVDQDTTSFDSAWAQESAQNTKFFKQKAAGVRDVFDRPTVKKRKT